MNTLLNIKHWQYFILMAIPFLAPYIGMSYFFNNYLADIEQMGINDLSPDLIKQKFSILQYLFYPLILTAITIFLWFWSIGIELQKILPIHLQRENVVFKIFLVIVTSYLISMPIGISNLVSFFLTNDFEINDQEVLSSILTWASIIVPLHIISIIGIIYCMIFCAKTIKTAENGVKKLSGDSFIGEFFLLWFYVIGVWILQPRINKLNSNDHQFDDTDLEY